MLAAIVGVALSSVAVAFLEGSVGVPDASSVYLVAVAAIAIRFGIPGAILTAVASVLVYDFLFVNPLHTLTVSDPGEWLNLVLLLFVAVTVGQLAALERGRAEAALERERESRALFDMTRALAVGESTGDALPAIAAALARDAEMDQVWIAFGADDAAERVAARSDDRPQPWPPRSVAVLQRPTERGGPGWTVVRPPAAARRLRFARPPLPGPDRGGRTADRVDLGSPPTVRPGARRVDEPAPPGRRGPGRAIPRARAADRGAPASRGRAAERRAEDGAAGIGLARSPDAARDDPCRRRDADRSGGRRQRG